MFKILQKTFKTGTVTERYPKTPADVGEYFRGRPAFEEGAQLVPELCPTGAISAEGRGSIDLGRCIFCGECTAAPGVGMTKSFELAVEDRAALVVGPGTTPHVQLEPQRVDEEIRSVLGRSLAIREVDAGSCNGCELEINALNNPVHDIERFGIHFVASPRHADMLLVTGPVTRNMEMALLKTYRATPDPKVVVAVGACGISGGIFGTNYATRGGVDQVVPVDVYIPGCPPRPQALLHGILLALGRLKKR